MSTPAAAAAAATEPTATDASPKRRAGKKKLLLIAAVVLLALALAGGAALLLLKKRAADRAEADGETSTSEAAAPKVDPGRVPVFVALDTFTVNLADRDAERYAQIGMTFELENDKAGDRIRAFMPAIRNNVLMLLSHKTSSEMMDREGKVRLAEEIRREALRPLGIELPPPGQRARAGDEPPPVRHVHFSNFIIQ